LLWYDGRLVWFFLGASIPNSPYFTLWIGGCSSLRGEKDEEEEINREGRREEGRKEGRTWKLLLAFSSPSGWFAAIGIFNQV
jgi:hypothetical protein